ncbi:hypothetical protein Tco_0375918, partial [Tanacetum coccineum]
MQDSTCFLEFKIACLNNNLNMGGGEGFDAEGDEDDSDTEEEAKEEEAIDKKELAPP